MIISFTAPITFLFFVKVSRCKKIFYNFISILFYPLFFNSDNCVTPVFLYFGCISYTLRII